MGMRGVAVVVTALAAACGSAGGGGDAGGATGRCSSLAFEPWASFDDVREVYSLAVADLDGDGAPDVVAGESTRLRVSIFLNHTRDGGGFERRRVPSFDNPFAVSVYDFDGDGRPEVYASASGDAGVSRLTDVTAATPPAPQFLPDIGAEFVGGLAEVQRGGARALVATSRYSYAVRGTAVSPGGALTGLFSYDAGNAGGPGVTGDLDGDGLDDAVFTTFFTGISVVSSRGNFATVRQATFANLGDVTAADVDSDGDLDVVQAANRQLGIYLNDGDGGFTPTEAYDAGENYEGVAVADFDLDGRADVVGVQGDLGHRLDVLAYRGGTLTLQTTFAADAGLDRPAHVVAADFDGDGRADLALSDFGAWTMRVFRNVSPDCPAPTPPGPVQWRVSKGCAAGPAAAPLCWLALVLARRRVNARKRA